MKNQKKKSFPRRVFLCLLAVLLAVCIAFDIRQLRCPEGRRRACYLRRGTATADSGCTGGVDESSIKSKISRPFSCKSQENGRDFLSYSVNQESIQMKFMADLVCNFIRQRTETDAGQGHAFSVFIKFFRLQLGVAGIPDKEEVFVFHKA